MARTARPLDGAPVLGLCRTRQGPRGGPPLAAAGAAVAKVEPPSGGGPPRRRIVAAGGAGVPPAMPNPSKARLSPDLGHPAGREVFLRSADRADAPVETFAPGAVDELGFGGAATRAHDPRPVRAAASGYGQTGRDAGRDAHRLAMDHLEVGRVATSSSPPRFEGAPAPGIVPGAPRDGDAAEVPGGMPGPGEAEREAPRAPGAVVGPGPGSA